MFKPFSPGLRQRTGTASSNWSIPYCGDGWFSSRQRSQRSRMPCGVGAYLVFSGRAGSAVSTIASSFLWPTRVLSRLLTAGESLLAIITLASISGSLIMLLAWERAHIGLGGIIGFVLVLLLLLLIISVNWWLGVAAMIVALVGWWRWGRDYFWLPVGFWGVVLAVAGGMFLVNLPPLSRPQWAKVCRSLCGDTFTPIRFPTTFSRSRTRSLLGGR